MTGRPVPVTPEAKFNAAIDAKIQEWFRRRSALVIPQVSADPPETEATNLWMRNDGRLRGRYRNSAGTLVYLDYPLRTDITSPPAVPANPSPAAPGSIPQTYRTTWNGIWSQTYQGSGVKRTDAMGETNLVYGQDPDNPTFGSQVALVGFDYATIVSTLAGTTIQRIDLTMANLDAYWSTVQISFGMHNATAEPTTYLGTDILLRQSSSAEFGAETKTVQLPMSYAQALRAGTAKGIALEAPSPQRDFYGVAAGVGSGGYLPPQLTVTYAK
jgi:hypothetical protein